MPRVSVLMSAYNSEQYIAEAIESILNQTFTDFEFIIINDGSTDDTADVIRKYAKQDKRIKFIDNKKNSGLISVLNQGLDICTGEYIARMDSDDIATPARFATQVEYLDKHNDVGVLGTAIQLFGADNKVRKYKENITFLDVAYFSPVAHPTVMIRRDVLERHNLRYNPEHFAAEDYGLWAEMVKVTKIHNLPDVLLKYRTHNTQISNVHSKTQRDTSMKIRNSMIDFLTDNPKFRKKILKIVHDLKFYDPMSLSRHLLMHHPIKYLKLKFNHIRPVTTNSPKIAILYIGLGRYSIFWPDFFETAEKYFIPNAEKTYFVFTDNDILEFQDRNNVIKIHQDKLGWPYDTMMRFDIFLKCEKDLQNFDYIFFFNANMKFIAKVGMDILPDDKHDGLVMGMHPGTFGLSINEFPYDRNPDSTACIPYNTGNYYVQGCLNGGTTSAYLELCRTCAKNVKIDLDKNIIALWHDESHLNKYILDKNPLVLPSNYLWPEFFSLRRKIKHIGLKKIKIIQAGKGEPKYGGIEWLRGNTDAKIYMIRRGEKVNIVQLMGGMGNQMFQYAFGYALGAETNTKVLYDLSWFEENTNDTVREYGLDYFRANVDSVDVRDSKAAKRRGIIREQHENIYQPNLMHKRAGKYFTGYFQTEKYFEKYRPQLLQAFSLKHQLNNANKKVLKQIQKSNAVSVHIRRGDYVKFQDIFGLCDLSYYKRAFDYIAKHTKDPEFFVFSDDIDWVRKNLKTKYTVHIVDINRDENTCCDIELMRNCKHNIIANSTFSWWGAWLNDNPDKIVIAPKQWYANGTPTDIIPEKWIRM